MTTLNVNIKDKAAWYINQLSFKHVFKHNQIKSSVYLCLQKTIVKDTYWCLHNQLQISHVLTKEVESRKSGQCSGRNFNDCLLIRTHCKPLLGQSKETEFIIRDLTCLGRERNGLVDFGGKNKVKNTSSKRPELHQSGQ